VYFFSVLFLHMYKNVNYVACSSVCHTVTVDTRCHVNKEMNANIYIYIYIYIYVSHTYRAS